MKLVALTITLDGQPWIERHLPQFEQMHHDWEWHVVHGAAMNGGSTRWCRPQMPRLSYDGTTEYLASLGCNNAVFIYQNPRWPSKDAMVNAPLFAIREPCVLMQIDSDECWTAEQLDGVVQMFEDLPHVMRAYFWCNYFVGPNIVTLGENCYGANPNEWLRAWRFTPGMRFDSHEPPVLAGNVGVPASRDFTRSRGLVFDHHAYELEAAVRFKEQFYGYKDAVKHWRRLQANTQWPCQLKRFLPWVDSSAMATKLT